MLFRSDALSLPPGLADGLNDGADAVRAADGDTVEDSEGDTEGVAAILSVSVSDGSGVADVDLEAAADALTNELIEDEPESDADAVAASLHVCVGVDASLVERVAVPPTSEFVSVGVDAAESDDVTLGEGSALALPCALTDGETQTIILKEKVTLVAFA